MDQEGKDEEIEALHDRISGCTVCKKHVPGYAKPPVLDRGDVGQIMVVGQGPGKAELAGTKAFAGQSGKTLAEWLVQSGADPTDPRRGIYFTSVIKCFCPLPKHYSEMAANCIGFLHQQISTIAPDLIITLGKEAFLHLRAVSGSYDESLCVLHSSSDFALITPWGFHTHLLHWPHPSGLNRWLNEDSNREKLRKSFDDVRVFLERN